MQIRIAEALIAIAITCFLFASLARADSLFDTLFFSFSLLFILVAALMAIGRERGARAYWCGFALSSASYLVFAHNSDRNGNSPRLDGPEVTTRLLQTSYMWLHPGAEDTVFLTSTGGFFSIQDGIAIEDDVTNPVVVNQTDDPFAANLSVIVSSGQSIDVSNEPMAFMRIGHAGWALLIGWVAAHFTQFVYQRSRRGTQLSRHARKFGEQLNIQLASPNK